MTFITVLTHASSAWWKHVCSYSKRNKSCVFLILWLFTFARRTLPFPLGSCLVSFNSLKVVSLNTSLGPLPILNLFGYNCLYSSLNNEHMLFEWLPLGCKLWNWNEWQYVIIFNKLTKSFLIQMSTTFQSSHCGKLCIYSKENDASYTIFVVSLFFFWNWL